MKKSDSISDFSQTLYEYTIRIISVSMVDISKNKKQKR